MKHLKYFSVLMLCMLTTSTMPVPAAKRVTQEELLTGFGATPVLQLSNILINDNVRMLKVFLEKNPKFKINQLNNYESWTKGKEKQRALTTGVGVGAYNCLKYLLDNNIQNIKSQINKKVPGGFTPLHYAQQPPQPKPESRLPHQTPTNYSKILTLLKSHGAKK